MTARGRVAAKIVARTMSSRVMAPILIVGALVATAGCGTGDGAPRPSPSATASAERGAPAEPTHEALVEDLLRRRAAALEAGDPRAYAATSIGPQRRRDRIAARRAAALRLRDAELEPIRIEVDGDRAVARTDAAYGIAGIRGVFHSRRRVVAVRKGGRWRVAGMTGSRGRSPWEVDDFAERRTPHFVVLSPPAVPAGALDEALEGGYATMQDLLRSGSLRRRYLVVVAADAEEVRALTTRIRGVETLAALSDAAVVQNERTERTEKVISLRLLVVWPAFAALDPDGRRRVVTHELTHAALTGSTSGRTPAWLSEGVALYVSGDRRAAPPGADLGALSDPDAIARLSGPAQAAAYDTSAAAAFAIADRFGRRRLLRLYDAFNQPRLAGHPGRRLADRAVRRVLGVSLEQILP
jgi:hypothetical protein